MISFSNGNIPNENGAGCYQIWLHRKNGSATALGVLRKTRHGTWEASFDNGQGKYVTCECKLFANVKTAVRNTYAGGAYA